ncbi:MAG: hypothetical protein GX091_06415 [Peptococcaceae bacterium]|nr:hypothetical protein [Peptococcaceae bacterium]
MQEYFIEVGTSNYREGLYRRLSDLRALEGLPFELFELQSEAPYLVRCVYSTLEGRQAEDRLAFRIYNYYFARALAEIVFQEWERSYVKKVLVTEYNFDLRDINRFMAKFWPAYKENKQAFSDLKKRILIRSILEFLDSNQRFNIEGFMNFRADQYKRELRKQIAGAVENYVLDQEHQGFINMLKKYLAKQTAVFPTLNVIIKAWGEVQFYDDREQNVSRECLEDHYRSDLELHEDILIIAIIKCAPPRLVVHGLTDKYVNMMKILTEVFEEKVSICNGCPLCGNNH